MTVVFYSIYADILKISLDNRKGEIYFLRLHESLIEREKRK